MERLTERTAVGILVKEDYGKEVLKTLYSCYGEKPNPHYTNCEEGYCAMEKLADYEDAEEQGRLVKLPCKLGDTVWQIMVVGVQGKNIKYGIKLCNKNIGFNGKFYTFPYFMTFMLKRFLKEKQN